jgi:hypothetical protein
MSRESATLSENIRQRASELESGFPGLDVFSVTANKLIESVKRMNFQPTAEPDYLVLANLEEQLEKQETLDSIWALAFIDLWYCRNFHVRSWRRLVKLDRMNIRFVIQAVFYIWSTSGKDHSADLADFVSKTATGKEAKLYLNTPKLNKELFRWAHGAIHNGA